MLKSLGSTAFAAVTVFSLRAIAQEAVNTTSSNPDDSAEVERVLVTGSLIPVPTAESEGPLPVVDYTRDQLVDFGANTPAEGLRHLPSYIGNADNENNSNRGTGAARINLRAFGVNNTLTMINSHRAFSFSDINAIPLGFIESIEILKDGASAIYGADAVAGVVNFKMRHAMHGGDVDILYGNTNLGVANDAAVRTGYIVVGVANDCFNVTAGASYYDRGAIYSRDTFLSSLADRRRLGGDNFLLDTDFPGRISQGASIANTGQIPGRPAGTFTNTSVDLVLKNLHDTPDSINDYVPFDVNNLTGGFDVKKYTPAIPEQDRYGFFLDGEYKVLPENRLTLFATVLYSRTKQYNGAEPSHFSLPGDVARSSPYNPVADIPQIDPATGQQAIDPVTGKPVYIQRLNSVSYAAVEAGPRNRTYDSEFVHPIVGLRGEFAHDYFWELSYVFDRNELARTDSGDQRLSLLAPEVANGSFNPFVGLHAPRQGMLSGFTYDNAAALRTASYTGITTTTTDDHSVDGKIGGRVFTDLPQGGMSFAVGFEFRREELRNNGDPVQVADDSLSYETETKYDADQDVWAGYLELNLPLITSTMNVPMVRSLDLDFAYRYERFAINGINPADGKTHVRKVLDTGVPKFALRWQPVADLLLRASYSRGFRTPTLREFFLPRTENSTLFPTLADPLAPGREPGKLTVVVPPGGTIVSGSVDLDPEKSDSYSAGFVLTPHFLNGLTMTADYYQLNADNVIVTGFTQLAVIRNAVDGSFADRIIRDSTGALFQVLDFPFNSAKRDTEGIDITAIYELPTALYGKFTFLGAYNHITRFNVQLVAGSGWTNFLGRFQNAASPFSPGSIPWNKAYGQVQWDFRGFSWVNTLNYLGDYHDFGADVNRSALVIGPRGPPDPANIAFTRNRRVKAWVTFDTQFSYTFNVPGSPKDWRHWLDRTSIRVGINNIFDEPPPFVAGSPVGDNYDTSLATLRGRYYYIGLNKKF